MIVYFDTSTLLRVLLRQPNALGSWDRWNEAYSSEISKVEARRVLDCLRLEGALDDEGAALARESLVQIEESIAFVGLTPRVLERASLPMPTIVKTLDALHLATALLYREKKGVEMVFATHDKQQSVAARALGFPWVG